MSQINVDLLDGEEPVSFLLSGKDTKRFIAFMDECQQGKQNLADQKEVNQSLADEINELWEDREKLELIEPVLEAYKRLHDGLSDMIESGRLTEADIPDDYQWLVSSLVELAGQASAHSQREDDATPSANTA